MNHKQLFEKAYSRLTELYGGENHLPDVIILSRFYREKAILSNCELYMRYLDLLSKIRESADQKGEHIFVRGTTGASFIAYLLGATDINPLPRHEYCPNCHSTRFRGVGTAFDKAPTSCCCGTNVETDGHNIPFAFNLKSVLSERIQLCVSHAFFHEAKAIICDSMWDKSIVTLSDGDVSPTWFCILDQEAHRCGDYTLIENQEIFEHFPRITLVPNKTLDQYRELEKATGFYMKDIGYEEESAAFFRFMECDIQGIPHFDNGFVKNIWHTINPRSYNDLLKLIGIAHSTNVWKNNAELLFEEHRLSFDKIPAYREELYDMISEQLRKKGIYDDGLAYEVADKTARGYYAKNDGMEEDTRLALLELGFDLDFIFFLSEIHYMFTKTQGVSYLREAIAMMVYKTKFNQAYREIMMEKTE